jgi:hypothetical protein
MKKLTYKQHEELFFYLERELKKLKEVFKKIKVKKDAEAFKLAQSYFQDAKHFDEKKEYVKAFELVNYVWGILDALAIHKEISVPKEIQKWFKTDFNKDTEQQSF